MSEIFRRNILDDKVKDNITLEKIEKESDSYTLPEFNERQEGVANWFKQMGSIDLKAPMEFPEGFYSVRDTMEEISKNELWKLRQKHSSWQLILILSLALACGIC